MKRLIVAALLVASLAACIPHPPIPPPQPAHAALSVVVLDGSNPTPDPLPPVEGALVTLHTGESGVTNQDGYVLFPRLILGERGILIRKDGYYEAFAEAKPFTENLNVSVTITRVVPPMQQLTACGKDFCTTDGQRWHWSGIDGFSLLFDLATGQTAKVDAYLAWAASERVSVIRVFTTAVNLFDLDPASGRAHVADLLGRAQLLGIRIELVGLADTRLRSFNHQEHIYALGQLAASYPNALIEVANEPHHETHESVVKEVAYLRGLKALVPEHVMVTLGPSHGSDDENPIYWIDSDYAVVHSDRKGGWDSVRHVREMQLLRDSGLQGTGKPVVNDEPDRNLTTDQHAGMGLLTRLYGLGDTVHLLPLMYGTVPSGEDLSHFRARRMGWEQFPHDWHGRYYNPSTMGGGPIRSFNPAHIVRLYGALAGNAGYIVGLGVQSEASIEWVWQHDRLVEFGQARLFSTRQ